VLVFKEARVLGARGVDGDAYAESLRLLVQDPRLARVAPTVVPLDAGAVAALLEEMAHGERRPLRAVIAPEAR
jgi:alcohol dehydrogenase